MEFEAPVPAVVRAAADRAADAGFTLSCEEPVGRLLATLAAAVPAGGRILELGTGFGVGTAWLVHGLGERTDVTVTTIELDAERSARARVGIWPGWVDWRVGDARELLPRLGVFDLVFADAEGGKITGLDLTLAALAPGGMLLVDDMDPARYPEPERRAAALGVRRALLADPRLRAAELHAASGVILSARLRNGVGDDDR
jgi:demethylmenaquinone methyltransferase/2-methoxy-6-polyprenyl-1,4-benzoquinol methylase